MIASVIKMLPAIRPEQVLASCFGILSVKRHDLLGMNVQSSKRFIRSEALKFDEDTRVAI